MRTAVLIFSVLAFGTVLSACNSRSRGGGALPPPMVDAGPPGTCGDGVRGAGELCDGTDVGDNSCESFRFTGGTLGCASDCQDYDFSMCDGEPGECGNGVAEPGELCDGADLGGSSCTSAGFGGGTLACASDCRAFDTTGCGDAPAGSPRILTFTTNVMQITEGDSVTFSLVATDPDGVDDIIGGTLKAPGTASSYGTLATAAAEGAYTLTLSWNDIHRVQPIDFTTPQARQFEAEIFDVAGNRAVGMISVTLTCGGDAACDGRCEVLESNAHCGACGNVCGDGSFCQDLGSGFVCACGEDEAMCGGVCQPLWTETNCGACGNSCVGGAFCDDPGTGYECTCSGSTEAYCPSLGCVDISTTTDCGGCGVSCAAGEFCRNTGGVYSCAMGYDMTAPTQTVAFNGGTNTFTFTGVPAVGTGTAAVVTITADGDFNSSTETASVAAEGMSLGSYNAGTCTSVTRTFNVADISSAAADGTVTVTFRTSSSVDRGGCSGVSDTVFAQLTI